LPYIDGTAAADADHLDRRLVRLGHRAHSRDQPAAADRHDQRLDLGRVLEQLERDGALARGHHRVVERVHEGQPELALHAAGEFVGLVVGLASSTTLPPTASVWRIFTVGVVRGMTIVTGTPSRVPWYDRPCAWLPAEAAITPRASARRSAAAAR
jgi:hypothetical protein